jgi:putative oxidoreductase
MGVVGRTENMARSIRSTLGLLFILTGMVFLAGTDSAVALFDQIGLGQWLRYAAGFSALSGGLLLLVRSHAILGSAIATAMSLGALLIQAFLAFGNPIISLIIAFLSGGALVQAELDQPVTTRRH